MPLSIFFLMACIRSMTSAVRSLFGCGATGGTGPNRTKLSISSANILSTNGKIRSSRIS